MEKDTKKRNKIIALSIGVLVVVAILAGSTYAYWQITKTQETPNDIVAACLNFTIENEIGSFGLEDAAPLTDEEGASLNGYTFSVENKCDEAVTYIVGLDALENSSGKYLAHENIKVKLDNKSAKIYGSLKDAGNPNVLASKQLSLETVEGKETNTHNVKIWIKSDAPVSEQGKGFTGQVFITGGQGIEAPGCFTIANDGTILGYDVACGGTDVVVPATIDGIAVKQINGLSFNDYNVAFIGGAYGDKVYVSGDYEYENQEYYYYFKNEEDVAAFKEVLKYDYCDDPANCDNIDELLAEDGMLILAGVDGYNEIDWSKYEVIETGEFMTVDFETMETTTNPSPITSLDLSGATELEIIGAYTIYGQGEYDEAINDTCEYDTSTNKYECNGDFSSITFPESGNLTEIGNYAFYGNQMSAVIIPSTVETIGEYAFDNNAISTLKFTDTSSNPSSLTTIGEKAFEENNLTKVVIPGSVTTIGYAPFYLNINLTDIIIKRADSTGLTQSSLNLINRDSATLNPIYATITYDPNYTE